MIHAEIEIDKEPHIFTVGDSVRGRVKLTVPKSNPNSNILVSFRGLAEVKWTECVGSMYYINTADFHDRRYYHRDQLVIGKSVNVVREETETGEKELAIPFEFEIPKDKNLPSSMISEYGFIKYFVSVIVNPVDRNAEVKKFSKEVVVIAPFTDNLMITVGGSVEKAVLLGGGKVAMQASIDRKGYARGESIMVNVSVDNGTNAAVTPRATLHQVQIFMSGVRHKTVACSEESVVGSEVPPHTTKQSQLVEVKIPLGDSLTIKSPLITVKYFVHVTLNIPHSFDLHLDLPVVITKQNVIGLQ